MYRRVISFVFVASFAGMSYVGVSWWQQHTAEQRQIAELHEKQKQLEAEKLQLQQVIDRLGTDKRVADVIVTDQKSGPHGLRTTLLFVEYDRTGEPLPPRSFTIEGTSAHLSAMVIEFDSETVVKNDPLRGHAIALFTRIFGENQPPIDGPRIDTPGTIPAFYKNADPKLAAFEEKLWNTFWELERDENLRKEMGVKVAVGKGVWGPFEPKTLYTITLQPDGNLSRTAQPMRGVYDAYIQMLRDKQRDAENPTVH
ncbi:MAG TPA: hypothetical protein VGB55_10070 [Tepidisphaeraceae bacterium]|jgi:hypothetical protein